VHLDSNATDAWTFERLAQALARRFDRQAWRIEAHDEYHHDQRLVGGQARMPALSSRLAACAGL